MQPEDQQPAGERSSTFRAAEYVRMSTEHQQYSTENQADKIREYAAKRGIEIIRTYADEGKSGLRIDGREALQRLLSDVESGQADFNIILVYDVSRWGRFQDADESAYYEYICRRAGMQVCYCAEQFENDGSPVSTIVKGVKRAMAGEYSRELSAKVFAGQCRLIELGFRQGGPAGFGLRRVLVDQAGNVKAKIEERQAEYPDIEVRPLQFSASELKASHWKFLMGAVGNQATYIRQIMRIMKAMRDDITLEGLRAGIDASSVPDHLKELARMRLELAADYINDGTSLTEVVRPGRLIIVDLRDEYIEKDEALGLFVVLLQLFADARIDGRSFNKLVVFDEAHKYIESPDLVAGLIEVVREMRHKGVSIMVASQDPPSVPVSLIELSSQIILHKFNSPAWLKHIQKANAALTNLTPERMALLKAGEAYVWSSKATDESFSKGAVKVRCRPRVTQHGGATRVAVKG